MGKTWLEAIPMNSRGSATRNPATGPAAPMSSTAFRLGIFERMRMTAPRVPKPRGSGMK